MFLSIQSYATAVYLLLVFPSFNHWCLLWLLLFNHCLFKLSHAWFLFVMVLIQTSALKEGEGEEFSEDLNLGIRGRSRGYELWYHWQCGGFLNCSHLREKKKIVSFFQAEQIEITQSLQQASKTWIELDLQIVIHSLEGKSMLSGCWVFYSFLATLQSIHFHLYWYLFVTLFLKEKI